MKSPGFFIALFVFNGCIPVASPPDASFADGPSTHCTSPAPCASPEAGFDAECARVTDHFDACGFHLGAAFCGSLSGAPTAPMRRAFECYARSECVGGADPCAPDASPASASVGERMNALCGAESFSDDLAGLIEYVDRRAWPDRVAALRVCETAADCDAMQACVRAWVDAVER